MKGFSDEDIKNEFNVAVKTEDEIKMLTIEENLNELERTTQILTKGLPLQKRAIYSNLSHIMSGKQINTKILEILLNDLVNEEEDAQIEVGRSLHAFLEICKNKKIKVDESNLDQIFKLNLLMFKSWSVAVLDDWLTLFQALLDFLKWEEVKSQCVNLVESLSDSCKPTQSRYVAARVLGFLAQKMKDQFQGSFVHRSKKLCQDHDVAIRTVMVEEVLQQICMALPAEVCEFEMLEKIMELVYDSEINVKVKAIALLFSVIDQFSQEAKQNRITSFYLKVLESSNDEVVKQLSYLLGTIVSKLAQYIKINNERYELVLKNFKKYSQHSDPDIRINFSCNFPAMVHSLDSGLFAKFKDVYFKLMLKDADEDVRVACVGALPNLAQVIGPSESRAFIQPMLVKLCKCDSKAIYVKLVAVLPQIIVALSDQPLPSNELDVEQQVNLKPQAQCYSQLLNSIIKLLNLSTQQWRIQFDLLKILQSSFQYFNIKDINNNLIPCIINLLKIGIVEVKKQCVFCIVTWLKLNYHILKRQAIISSVKSEMFGSMPFPATFQNKLIFIYFVSQCCQTFSRGFMKSTGLVTQALNYVTDKVPNVRLKVAEVLFELQCSLFEDDVELQGKIGEATTILRNDKDSDVIKRIKKTIIMIETFKFSSQQTKDKQIINDNIRIQQEQQLQAKEVLEQELTRKKQLEDIDQIKIDKKNKKTHNQVGQIQTPITTNKQPAIKDLSIQHKHAASLNIQIKSGSISMPQIPHQKSQFAQKDQLSPFKTKSDSISANSLMKNGNSNFSLLQPKQKNSQYISLNSKVIQNQAQKQNQIKK